MPPSGFNREQAKQTPNFLMSCWAELRKEGEEEGLSPILALQHEIGNIEMISVVSNSLIVDVLSVIRRFYEMVLSESPESYSDAEVVAASLCELLNKEMSELHVPNIANVSHAGRTAGNVV